MEKITNIKGNLLEGCVWDEYSEKLYFVDILCRKIYILDALDNHPDEIDLPDYVGCIVPDQCGNLIAALPDGLYRVDTRKKTKEKIMDEALPEGLRYNDGKCDPSGRLWAGSMAICQESAEKGAGSLYCIENETVIRAYPGYSIPNGLAWDEKKSLFYHIDTPEKRVDRYRIGENAELKDRATAIDLRQEEGSPDGMCIDAEGNLWIAMWGGNKVICADPGSGKILEEIPVPDALVSCCTFGGKDLDILYVTTARDGEGDGGHLYMQKMNVKGVTVNRYVSR